MISTAFIQRVAEVVAPVLTGSQIVSVSVAYAVDFNVDIPHAAYPFTASSKKAALFENLQAFDPAQQYQVIYELCERIGSEANATVDQKSAALNIKWTLLTRYSNLANSATSKAELPVVVTQAKHWLTAFPSALKLYEDALLKHAHGVFPRNMLDDLRLSLESLLKELFRNGKSLENQLPEVGRLVKSRGGSPELANMFEKLLDYYGKYHNTYVKHDDSVPPLEAEFVVELSACFMKHLIRVSKSAAL